MCCAQTTTRASAITRAHLACRAVRSHIAWTAQKTTSLNNGAAGGRTGSNLSCVAHFTTNDNLTIWTLQERLNTRPALEPTVLFYLHFLLHRNLHRESTRVFFL
eukprot:SAG31_NODE_1610_length_7751_cov_2.938447_4_plen_104_part_00